MDELIVFGILVFALVFFIWDRFRYDIVAISCLLALVLFGITPAEDAFVGFAHPAVVTVAVILVVSAGLQSSGLVDMIGNWVMRIGKNTTLQVAALSTIVAFASAFMNNIGALAVMMPVALHLAKKSGNSPSSLLMPIAFASLLGGMITLIGTPPNIIISSYRSKELGEAFRMFDFAPVGIGVTLIGLIFIILLGWRWIPKRISGSTKGDNYFDIDEYITEVIIEEDSKLQGNPLMHIHEISDAEIQVLNVIRSSYLIHAPDMNMVLREGDIITISSDGEDLKEFLEKSNCKLVPNKEAEEKAIGSSEISIVEAVIMAEAPITNQTASSLSMRNRFGVNLLAISRQDKKIKKRLDKIKFKVGDVLLIQGNTEKINDSLQAMGCLPLADRGFDLGKPKKVIIALAIFIISIGLVITDFVPVQISFTLAALAMILSKTLSVKDIYQKIDWPVIVLLGAMLPLGTALEETGGANTIASQLIRIGTNFPPAGTLTLFFVTTMLLSNVINNAACAVLMAPIALRISEGLDVSPEPFLMAIAIAASAAFLTPIGHQSNTLVMGPGGYAFKDYLRMGIPISILITLGAIPMILFFWPL
ncbi:SLC13 family permease [Belliella kenyensis]|uniref:SLC13 family permease n=1 Tax=Belliella kenyensis TaxID=1472724 RepID=A0ABV8EM12_9BACT|nr:SLC13 family permease [Belliella kenyensis]MCH7403593.1 SLC13 family permease [Belliella kenyensis]MDN3603855.1 SLC13 family permease [Belliella kenyensis]